MIRLSLIITHSPFRVTSVAPLTNLRHLSSVHHPDERQENGMWLHKLDETQKMFVYGHQLGARFNTPTYTLNSRKPLPPEVVHRALKLLQRKSPNHQVVIRKREGELWFYRTNDLDIDFKVHGKGTPKLDLIRETWRPFDEANGPTSRAHLVLADDDDDKCLFPDIKKEYPYQYYLTMCHHHSIIDGTSGYILLHPMMGIINAITEGENLDDCSPIGEFVSGEEYQELFLMYTKKLSENPDRLELLKKEVFKSDKTPILLTGFPRPTVDVPETRYQYINIGQDLLHKFIGKCKENGVTFGNAFHAVTNTALVELVQDAGGTDDSYDLSAHYSVNIRRYMRRRTLPILGCHVRTMASVVTMEKNVRDNFWNNCWKVQRINQDLVKSGAPIEQDVVRRMFLPHVVPAEDFFKAVPQTTRDFGYNNLGSILMYSPGKHVQLTDIENYTTLYRSVYPFYTQVYSYGSLSRFMLSYSTDWLTEETAFLLTNKIKSVIEYFSLK